jgi:transposase-like protein
VIGLHNKEDKTMRERTVKYSEAFKLQVIKAIERGEFSSLNEAMERYGIGGGSTINSWLKKYRREDILPKKVRIEMPNEISRIKKLKKRIHDLEKALADAKVGEVLSKAYFEILCEDAGIEDIEGYKKKVEEELSRGERK